MEQSLSSPQLEYEPAKQVLRRRRGRRAVVGLIVLMGGIALWRAGPPFLRQVRYVYRQSRCMDFTKPADFVAYEEEPTRAATLLSLEGYQGVATVSRFRGPLAQKGTGYRPPPLNELRGGGACTAFLHARRTPAGRNRLVVVTYDVEFNNNIGRRPDGRVVLLSGYGGVPATLVPGAEIAGAVHRKLCLVLEPDAVLRIFWGQPDPDHADHFTIGYELNDQRGTIDGWLKDDSQLDLRVRDGPATRRTVTLPY